jgi:hypothetical protein
MMSISNENESTPDEPAADENENQDDKNELESAPAKKPLPNTTTLPLSEAR